MLDCDSWTPGMAETSAPFACGVADLSLRLERTGAALCVTLLAPLPAEVWGTLVPDGGPRLELRKKAGARAAPVPLAATPTLLQFSVVDASLPAEALTIATDARAARVTWDLSKVRGDGPHTSPTFATAGVPDLQLVFERRGEVCGLFLAAPAGARIVARGLVDKTVSAPMDKVFTVKYRAYGWPRIHAAGTSRVGLEITAAEFVPTRDTMRLLTYAIGPARIVDAHRRARAEAARPGPSEKARRTPPRGRTSPRTSPRDARG